MKTHGKTGTCAYVKLRNAKHRARRNNLPYNLTLEFVEALLMTTKTCPICGVTLVASRSSHNVLTTPSVDKLIPSRGYVEDNVNIICWRCNSLKNNATPEELRRIADWVEERSKSIARV